MSKMRLTRAIRIRGWLFFTLILVVGIGVFGCSESNSDAAAVSPDGSRLTNVELMFITRGSLEGEIAPNG